MYQLPQRELEFKVRDKQKNKRYEPIYEAYKGKLYELLLGLRGDLNLRTMTGLEHESTFPDRYQIVQYTGLKDKNGEKIFEGDIVLIEKSFIQHGEGYNEFSNTKIVGDKAIHYGVLFMNVSSEDYKEGELQSTINNRYRVYGQKVGVVVFGEYDFCLEYYSESHNGWSVKPLVVEESDMGNEKQNIPLLELKKFEIIGNVFENSDLILTPQGE